MISGIAFLFPGQGSQYQGMLAEFLQTEATVTDTFAEASDVLGYDMRMLVSEDPDHQLQLTEFTQPALLTASTALLRVWRQRHGPEAGHLAGHSLGEYSALVAAGSLSFADAVTLVAFRGRAMNDAVAEGVGRMAAILGLEDDRIEELCGEASTGPEKVWPANYNCPGQLVVAGHAKAVDRLMELAISAGARRVLPLQVSSPSHTPLMQPVAEAMRHRLKGVTLKKPAVPVWSNALASPLQKTEEIRRALIQQLISPVRWSETIRRMRRNGVCRGVEMGPGKVLAGIVRRIERELTVYAADTPECMEQSLNQISGGEQ